MEVVELFSGAGGMSLGLKQAGFSVRRAYDFWAPALAVYEANFGTMTSRVTGGKTRRRNLGGIDIKKLKEIDTEEAPQKKAQAIKDLIEELEAVGDIVSLIPEIFQLAPDMIVGGPPCQPWSQLGLRKGDDDPRARLTTAFGTVIAAVRPQYFLMENVKQIRRYNTFRQVKAMLKKTGYGLTEVVLNSSFHGVAQARERYLMIGCLGECDGWLLDHLAAAKSDTKTTVADILGADFGMPHFHRQTPDGKKVWSVADADTKEPTVNFFWLSPSYKNRDVGSKRADRPIKTILRTMLARRRPDYLVKPQDTEDFQALPMPTFEQLTQLGGFPATWKWSAVKSETTRMQILTNAVPPPMASVVGRCIMAHRMGEAPLTTSNKKAPKGFVQWLEKKMKLKGPRLSQTVSEFNAVKRLLGSRRPKNYQAAFTFLNGLPIFQSLGASRKSNLRRALRLYTAYDHSRRWSAVEAQKEPSPRRWRSLRRRLSPAAASNVPAMPGDD